ncbi:MAG: hypothetical protein KKA62_02205, partial [Nanoarchaeota archaeon]|nr:hypothetical protein [Nanoarchaeota archaeon]
TSAKVNNADVVNVKGDKDYVELNLGLNFSLEFPINSQKYSLNLPKVPVNIPALGVYADSIGNSDSSYVPFNECTLDGKKGKGWIYYPNATDIAFYDFSIIQGNNNLNYNQKVHTLINVVKNVNSNQKVILRLALPAQVVLEYNYNESTRNYVKQNLLDQIKGGPLNLYGVTLSEEELAVQFSGFNGQSVPEWLNKYVPQYEAETNKKFETQNSQDVINWLSEKAKIFFNELHTYVKSNYPNIKVMQWVYIPGDNSGWAWIEPKALNKDGWIIQWHGDYKVSLLKPAVHKLSVITTVYVKERSFNIQTQKLRDAGVPNSEIYANINGYDAATMGTALWQLEMVREVGINNVFVFYYGAFVPPKPLTDCAPIFFNTSNGLVWKSSYDDRLKFENYSKNLK